MARRIRSADLETRTARLKLDVRKKPYTARIAPGIRLAYRRNQICGVWSVLKADGAGGAWLQRFALADDHEESNGSTVLTFWEAAEIARKLARGDDPVGEVEAGRPVTIREAVAAYERDLKARDAGLENAKWLRYHLTPALMSKPVAMLTQREVRALRDSLIDKVPRRSTVNRFMRAFKACLTLAANDDERITNRKAWKLPALRDTANPRNVILTEPQVRDVVAASYQTGGYKTFVMLDLSASVMTKAQFAGREVHRQGGVLLLAAEGQSEVRLRVEGVARERVAGFRPVEDVIPIDPEHMPFVWRKSCPRLADPRTLDELRKIVTSAATGMKERFGLAPPVNVIQT